jgi:hypothetical protein
VWQSTRQPCHVRELTHSIPLADSSAPARGSAELLLGAQPCNAMAPPKTSAQKAGNFTVLIPWAMIFLSALIGLNIHYKRCPMSFYATGRARTARYREAASSVRRFLRPGVGVDIRRVSIPQPHAILDRLAFDRNRALLKNKRAHFFDGTIHRALLEIDNLHDLLFCFLH